MRPLLVPFLLLLGSCAATEPAQEPGPTPEPEAAPPRWEPVSRLEIAGYEGGGLALMAGDRIRITDLEGRQICDFYARARDEPREHLDTRRTMLWNGRIYPTAGQVFYSNRGRPMLTFLTDGSPGVHDWLWVSCDDALYRWMGQENHPNCHDNYRSAARALGLDPEVEVSPVNFFQNTRVGAEGAILSGAATSEAGDYVELRAEMDLYVIATACAFDIGSAFNGEKSTPILLEVLPGETAD